MPPRPFRAAFALAFASAMPAAVLAAFVDLAVTWARAGEPIGADAFAWAAIAALGLYGVARRRRRRRRSDRRRRPLRHLRRRPGAAPLRRRLAPRRRLRPQRCRRLVASALALGVVGAVVLVYDSAIAMQMAAKRNAALTTAMVAVVAVPIAALAWFPLYRLAARSWSLVPRPRALVVLGALVALALFMVVAAVLSVDWRIIDFGPAESLAALLRAAGDLRPRCSRAAALLRRRRRRRLALLALCLGDDLGRLRRQRRARWPSSAKSRWAKRCCSSWRAASPTHDHDGYAARLGGGDCNDHDPEDPSRRRGDPRQRHRRGLRRRRRPAREGTRPSRKPTRPPPPSSSGTATSSSSPSTRCAPIASTPRPRRTCTASCSRRSASRTRTRRHPTRRAASRRSSPRAFRRRCAGQKASLNFPPMLETADNTTLFQALKAAGFYEVGVFSHFYLTKEMGVTGGFDEWHNDGALSLHDSNTDSAAPRIAPRVASALRGLAKSKMKWLLWTHFFEPHSRYMEHHEFPVHDERPQGSRGEVRRRGLVRRPVHRPGARRARALGPGQGHRGGHLQRSRRGLRRASLRRRAHVLPRPDPLRRALARAADDPRSRASRRAPSTANVMLLDLGPTLVDLVKAPRPPTHPRPLAARRHPRRAARRRAGLRRAAAGDRRGTITGARSSTGTGS